MDMRSSIVSGCEAAARGLWEGGATLVTGYPGSPVTGVVDAAGGYPELRARWAVNEKAALELAAGAAYSGTSAATVMKHVGLNVAADTLFNLAYTGVGGALVVLVGDDPGATCSQNEQDTRLLGLAARVPVLEPADINEALVYTRLAFEISRQHDLPVLVRLTTALCYGLQNVVHGARRAAPPATGFPAPVQKYLLLPGHVPARHAALLASLEGLAESSWSRFLITEHWPQHDPQTHELGLVCAGQTAAKVREVLEGRLPILQVGLAFPLDRSRLQAFASRCRRLVVTEECSDHLAVHLRGLGPEVITLGRAGQVGEFRLDSLRRLGLPELTRALDAAAPARRPLNLPLAVADPRAPVLPAAPERSPGFCAGCSHTGPFDVLRRLGLDVVGDIGCYTLGGGPAFGALHANLCMGASACVLQGYLLARPDARQRTVAVIGDSTFFHSGIPGVLTAVANGHHGTLLVLDNSGSAMTGFQPTGPALDEAGWSRLLGALGVTRHAVEPALDLERVEARLREFQTAPGFGVLVLKGDCVQSRPRRGPTNFRYTVLESRCTGCGQCVERTDCPALERAPLAAGGLVRISSQCVGCGLCSQTCPEAAIVPLTVRTRLPWLNRAASRLPWHRLIRALRRSSALRRFAERFERELD